MEKLKVIGIIILGGAAALTLFHVFHYLLFCRYKGVPGKSHCDACGHRKVCRKIATRRKASNAEEKARVGEECQ